MAAEHLDPIGAVLVLRGFWLVTRVPVEIDHEGERRLPAGVGPIGIAAKPDNHFGALAVLREDRTLQGRDVKLGVNSACVGARSDGSS